MGCIAQVCPTTPVTACCKESDSCSPFITPSADCILDIRTISCCIIKGTVQCVGGGSLEGVLVFATGPMNVLPDCPTADPAPEPKTFAGITNANGDYCICVKDIGQYEIECFCCSEDCCEQAPCDCACNGNDE